MLTQPRIKFLYTEPDSLESRVGNTPLIRLKRITDDLPSSVQVFAKAEWFNPSGSVKDRPALNIIHDALNSGKLDPTHQRLLDSTSGNMGIAYATFGAARGIGITLAVPANASPERLSILKTLGAELILTDPLEGSDGAILEARRLAQENPERYYYANQYNNPANWQAHYNGTAPEIIEQTDGQRRLKEFDPSIQLISAQPNDSFHGLEGLKHIPTAIKPAIYDETLADDNISVNTEEAQEMTLRLARDEGLFVGVSSGAAAVAALTVARTLETGIVVTVFPDAGFKYLSERFWNQSQGEN
ncbi:MAG: cysteine synthase family protein [Chloroflexi bacterium]|nr:cysteine synthase family protein [Chloroflexota bacterium]